MQFKLVRNFGPDVLIPVAPMTGPEILAIYDEPEQDRRKAEIVSWLSREDENVDASNFQDALATKLANGVSAQEHALWVKFGSRLDMNIAIAGRRGFRDDFDAAHPWGPIAEYELVGDFGGGSEVQLGKLSIDTTTGHVLPGADDLEQVLLSRCDAPEQGKDTSMITLNWGIPEEGVDEYRNGAPHRGLRRLSTHGAATSRSLRGDAAPVEDFRALASVAAHDAKGELVLAGFEKVNDQPVVVSGGKKGQTEERYKGFNSPYSQFAETPEQVAAAGLAPGDTCPYYVVARDVTGNYSETREVLVTVPDLQKPPAPWTIETITDYPNGELDIQFDHVNVQNYYDDHQARPHLLQPQYGEVRQGAAIRR